MNNLGDLLRAKGLEPSGKEPQQPAADEPTAGDISVTKRQLRAQQGGDSGQGENDESPTDQGGFPVLKVLAAEQPPPEDESEER